MGAETMSGQLAVVTGGASGIGRACALAFADLGADVAIADVNADRLRSVAEEIGALGRRVWCHEVDVTSDEQMDAFGAAVRRDAGVPDVLMNNAGASLLGRPERMTMDEWRWQLDVNLLSVVRGVRAFVPWMIERGSGYVVNTASVAGLYGYSWDSIPYITSKFGVVGMSEGLAFYLGKYGIGVSVLCPGLVATNLGETARFAGVTPEELGAGFMHFPEHMQRAIEPEEVAQIVVDGIAGRRFLLLTHPEDAEVIAARRTDIDAHMAWQRDTSPQPPEPPAPEA